LSPEIASIVHSLSKQSDAIDLRNIFKELEPTIITTYNNEKSEALKSTWASRVKQVLKMLNQNYISVNFNKRAIYAKEVIFRLTML
jgi:hypothetical protein